MSLPNLETRGISLTRMAEIERSGNFALQVYLAAIEYINQGIYVIPIEKGAKSLPYNKESGITYGAASRKKEIIDKWFDPHTGKFAGWNIGIATGRESGVFAIDVDCHDGATGLEELEEIEKEHGEIYAPMQITPTGGRHYLFNWQENAASTTSKISKSIDTRGGTDKACKGHIVAFPSVVNNKTYTWAAGGAIPEVPKWAMERLGVTWRPPMTNRGNENVSEEDVEQKVPISQLKSMLESIDINLISYEEWLRIGLAIKSQYPDKEGLKVWDDWSQTGERYKKNECSQRWDGFSDFGTVRMGTLFYIAKDHGWEPKGSDIKGNKYDMVVERLNRTYAIVTVGGKIRILREKKIIHDTYVHHYELMDKDGFKTLLMNDVINYTDNRGRPKSISVADVWLAHESRRTYPDGMGLFPDGKVPPGYYNTWNGFAIDPRKGECNLFLRHIKEVICNGDEYHYNWVLDWCADAIQDPSNPKGTSIVMRGEEGAGKGTLANTMGEYFGPHYRHLIDDSHLLSNFNAHMIDAVFVFADEITWGGNTKTSGKLKGIVTERYLVGERKGIDAVGYRNMIHMMIASNAEWVVPAGSNSRRWFMLDVSDSKIADRDYFNAIQNELENGGKEAFLYLLMNREITNDLRRAPVTKALKEQRMRSSANDSVLQWWINSVERGMIDIPDEQIVDVTAGETKTWPELVTKINLYEDYKRWCDSDKRQTVSLNIFYTEVKKYNIRPTRITIGGKKRPLYKIPEIDKAYERLKQVANLPEEDEDDE